MLNSTTLEVAIGMALVYLVLSLFCTAINETIAGILGSRGKNLEKGIRSLFTEGKLIVPPAAAGTASTEVSLVDAIYQHGLIQSLYRSGTGILSTAAKDLKDLPSYIPSRTFASALFDLLFAQPAAPAAAQGAAAQAVAQGAAAPAAAQGAPAPTAAEVQAAQLRAMLASLENISGSPAKQAIATLVRQADGDVQKTRQALESWFNDGMDRASGWYKRRTQAALFVIGLVVAVVLNVDSIRVAEVLWNTPAVRSYAVAAADAYVKSQPTPTSAATAAPADPSGYMAMLNKLNLPLGWAGPDLPWNALKNDNDNLFPAAVQRYGFPLIGWLLTAIAMTLGAPFWFDALNQFMVIRSTIKPDEKSGVEASKDPQKP